VSNFLKSLVQRGAGLPLPVTIRPAAGPGQQAGSASVSHEESETNPDVMTRASLVKDESALAGEVPNADFAEQNNSTLHQAAVTLPEPRSTTQSPLPIRLPVASPTIASPEMSADEGQPRPHPISSNSQPQEPLAATRTSTATGEQERATPSPFLQENRPGAQPLPSKPEPRVIPQDVAVDSLPSRLAPQQEHFLVVRLPQPAPSATRVVEKRTTPERSIQVKIGRVEIRSNQPATVVKPTRPPSSGGFDNWKLARTYLDRSLR